ncbi:MAG: Rieske 2Fe-2S domain-containing protein [Rhizobiales bacterium]|nr:Rieske 2Fe-2S domain-containing protein [Hyphomicrobiales bacterium]MBI3673996.1 Rieske 2Fe-2S domain-containing protein [Hyphomicrobiales bacterium]
MNLHSPPLDPVAELAAMVAVPFEQAHAMPKSVYTSEIFLAAELEHVFRKEWHCVGRASGLANPGDYLTFELAGQPLMVIRDRDGTLHAQSNVCLHRMSTLLEGRGNRKSISCPYHGWTYNTDGSLRGAPAMTRNAGFCKEDYKLPQVRCETWLGWVFVSLNPDVEPVANRLAEVESLIGAFDMVNYTEWFNESFVWNTNWKVLAENFMESYHLPVCHAGTIGGLSKLDEMVCPPSPKTFNYHTILKEPHFRIAGAHPSNARMAGDLRRTTFLLALYPSLLITLTPGYFWYLSLLPKGVAQVHVTFGGGMCNDFLDDMDVPELFRQLKDLLDKVNVEDKGCTERVYRGLTSELAAPGHLSHLERPNFDFATYLSRMTQGG